MMDQRAAVSLATTAAPMVDYEPGEDDPEMVPVHLAWLRVRKDVRAIAKGEQYDDGWSKYSFRGVDATVQAAVTRLRPVLMTSFCTAFGALPLMLMLIGLVFRGVAFEFRFKARERYRHIWDKAFAGGSYLATFAQGLESLRSPRRFAEVFFWALLHWLVNALAFQLAFLAIGLDAPFSAALFLQGLISIGVALPAALSAALSDPKAWAPTSYDGDASL